MARPETDVDADAGTSQRGLSATGTRVLAGLLVLLTVAAAVFGVVQFLDYREHTAASDDRDQALATANQFALRMDNFRGDDLAGYSDQVNEVLTTKARAQFKESFPAFEEIYKKGKATGVGKVRASAIQEIDPDSATALVIHDRLVKSDYGDQQQYLRWVVELDKVDGTWLVDKFTAAQ